MKGGIIKDEGCKMLPEWEVQEYERQENLITLLIADEPKCYYLL